MTPGQLFRKALHSERPLQLPGVINAYAAILAKDAGFQALYLSGAGVANASYGLPDLGKTTLDHVLEDVRRITSACDLPLLVDADTGWDDPGKSIAAIEQAGAAGCHLEDQTEAKRCGHRPNKQVVTTEVMCDRLKAAVDARCDESFVIMARTDAVAPEGLPSAIDRCQAYLDAGADMIFCEALGSLDDYRTVTAALDTPVLANITEFGKTPLFTLEELENAGIAIALYPLSAFRAMSKAAMEVYTKLRSHGTQQASIDQMQTRDELYQHLRYHEHEADQDSTHKNNPSS
ncbi:methylisocitrate lyase [Haloferula sp.]|uniref:methylisocitrate lyase n=1 Tax=Haloferula sp. TaxID=2497595 RepID=UPI003C7504CF